MPKIILIVEDEPSILTNLGDAVEYGGYLPLLAHNSIEALELLEIMPVDCIIFDIKMPGKNGLQLAKELRNIGVTVPFIFQTAWLTPEALREASLYGRVLVKPFVLKEITDLIAEVLKDNDLLN